MQQLILNLYQKLQYSSSQIAFNKQGKIPTNISSTLRKRSATGYSSAYPSNSSTPSPGYPSWLKHFQAGQGFYSSGIIYCSTTGIIYWKNATVFSITFYFLNMEPLRGGSTISATSKMEFVVPLVNCWILDVAEVLYTPQGFKP